MSTGVSVRILSQAGLLALLLGADLRGADIDVPDPGEGIFTIQDGVDAAIAGDILLVAPGVYVESVDTSGKAIRIRSTGTVQETVIDTMSSEPAVLIANGEGRNTVIQGLTLRSMGNSIQCTGSSPTIRSCIIDAGQALCVGGSPRFVSITFTGHKGGPPALQLLSGADPDVESCDFTANSSASVGGAANATGSAGHFIDCTFTGNTAALGGGVSVVDSSTRFTDCTFDGNAASNGGGAWLVGGTPVLERCTFRNGSAMVGAGVYITESEATLTSCDFEDNIASQAGGGVRVLSGAGTTFIACDFSSNSAPEGAGADVTDDSHDLLFLGCSFVGEKASIGGGMDVGPGTGVVQVESCLFQDTVAEEGGAICARGGGLLVRGGTVRRGVSTALPGAIRGSGSSSHIVIANVAFEDNDTGAIVVRDADALVVAMCGFQEHDARVMEVTGTDVTVVDCLLTRNTSPNALVRFAGAPASLVNCSIIGNTITAPGATVIDGGAATGIANTIFWSNHNGSDIVPVLDAGTVTYSCVEGGWPGDGNVSSDPQLMNPSSGDYRISTCSPCRDAGSTGLMPLDIADLDDDMDIGEPLPVDMGGDSRLLGASVDIGAYEVRAPMTFNVPGFASTVQEAIDHTMVLGGDEIALGPGVWMEPVSFNGKPVHIRGEGAGITTIDTSGTGSRALTVAGGAWGCGVVEGCTLVGGSVTEGGTVQVTGSRLLLLNCEVIGGDAQRGGGVAVVSGADVSIEGCDITSNDALIGGGLYVEDASLRMSRSTISSNSVLDSGGGLYVVSGDVTIAMSRIQDHDAPGFGGGIYAAGDVSLISTILENNTAGVLGGHAAAAADGSSGALRLINTTMVGGSAQVGGGIYNLAGGLAVHNSVLHDNTDGSGTGFTAQIGGLPAMSLAYSLIMGASGSEGPGVQGGDPEFMDPSSGDYAPGPGSMLVDAGDSNAMPSGFPLDIVGHSRFVDVPSSEDKGLPDTQGRVIDIGAYEAPAATPTDCEGDADGDGNVTFSDLNLLLDQWGTAGPEGDFDNSGAVDFADLNELLDNWGCVG